MAGDLYIETLNDNFWVTLKQVGATAVEAVYQRGVAQGVFRPDVDPVDLHMSISALAFFNVSNRATFSLIFKRDLDSPESMAARRASIIDMVVRHVRQDRSGAPT